MLKEHRVRLELERRVHKVQLGRKAIKEHRAQSAYRVQLAHKGQ